MTSDTTCSPMSSPLIRYSEALSLILATHCRNRDIREIPIDSPGTWTLAETVMSDQAIPQFANSAMDGFAVLSEQTRLASPENPIRFQVWGSLSAGDPPVDIRSPLPNGCVWEVMTGAPIPIGFDAVVKVEDVSVVRSEQGVPLSIELRAPAVPRQFYRDAGTDFSKGEPAVSAGYQMTPEIVLALSALGVTQVRVLRKPRVAVVSTGKELVPAGAEVGPGQIRNSTAPFLKAALERLGAESSFYHSAVDDPNDFMKEMNRALRGSPDVIVTTGGVSMGKHDYVKGVLTDLGARIQFHKIAIRPGKPNLFGEFVGGPAVFGIPGNPVSTMVGLRFLVEPFLRKFMGRPQESPLRAQLDASIKKPDGLRCFLKAKLKSKEGISEVRVLSGQDSFQIRPLLEADAWAVAPEEGADFSKGSWMDVYPLFSMQMDRFEKDPIQYDSRKGGCCS